MTPRLENNIETSDQEEAEDYIYRKLRKRLSLAWQEAEYQEEIEDDII